MGSQLLSMVLAPSEMNQCITNKAITIIYWYRCVLTLVVLKWSPRILYHYTEVVCGMNLDVKVTSQLKLLHVFIT